MKKRSTLAIAVAVSLGFPSAGIEGQATERWKVSAEPAVALGTVDGPEGEVLVAVSMATVLSDGSIVLRNSDRNTFEIRYFDDSGSHVHTASRYGEGPFEFRSTLGAHRLAGDSIFVAGGDDRFAVFGQNGERVREGRMGLRPLLPLLRSHPIDATHLALQKAHGSAMPETGTQRDSSTLFVYDLVERRADTLAIIFGRRVYYERIDRGVAMYPAPFGPETFVATGGGLVWIGDNETSTIRGYRTGGGDPEVVVSSPFQPRAVTRAVRSRMRDMYSTRFSGDIQRRWARIARSMEFPDEMPWFGQLKVDRLGNLWVQEYEPPWEEEDQQWVVFSPKGEYVADVSVPPEALPDCARGGVYQCNPGSGIFEIGADYLLLEQSDEWGVRYVRKYPIEKPTRGSAGRRLSEAAPNSRSCRSLVSLAALRR